MKLQTKITIGFAATILVALGAVGSVAYQACYTLSMKNVSQSMETSAKLASRQIGALLNGYESMAEVTGEDPVISNTKDKEARVKRIEELAADYGFTSGNILDEKGVSIIDGTDFSDREYVQKALNGEVNFSEVTLSKYTNTYGCSVAAPISEHGDESSIKGVVYFRMDITFMERAVEGISVSDNSYAYIVDGTGMMVVHPDTSILGQYNLNDQNESQVALMQEMLKGEPGSTKYDKDGKNLICGYAPINGTAGWSVVVSAPDGDFTGQIQDKLLTLIGVDIFALVAAIVMGGIIARSIGKKAKLVQTALSNIAEGDFTNTIETTRNKDELGVLQNSAAQVQEDFINIIGDANKVLEAIANYDLSVSDMKEYPGEFNRLSESINSIKNILSDLIREVQESASSVGIGSGQLADAADALSRGTVAQASSIDSVVENVQDVVDKIRNNSENEQVVDEKLKNLEELIHNGNSEMTELLRVVREVEEMSSDVQKIVGTIDSIAFQTNILALNASVEAARAGENGKGFAVVADEVGSLASKTSEASKQTAELIGRCIDGIKNAMKSADSTFECLKEIVEDSEEISKAFDEISEDTREQAEKSLSIRQEMGNISDVVQTNTATAQQTAAATQELSQQARTLSTLIQKFHI